MTRRRENLLSVLIVLGLAAALVLAFRWYVSDMPTCAGLMGPC
jgi:hypothetical protein